MVSGMKRPSDLMAMQLICLGLVFDFASKFRDHVDVLRKPDAIVLVLLVEFMTKG